jgi:hypothetical protein
MPDLGRNSGNKLDLHRDPSRGMSMLVATAMKESYHDGRTEQSKISPQSHKAPPPIQAAEDPYARFSRRRGPSSALGQLDFQECQDLSLRFGNLGQY